MNLKRFIHLLPPKVALAIDVFIALVFAFGIYVYSEKKIDAANERLITSYQLAEELRQSSDELTRMMRTYIITGNSRYKQHYQEILDIRNGISPRPEGYRQSYWDLVIANHLAPPQNGRKISLQDLMRENGFTEVELNKLAEAEASSDALSLLELDAMKMAESGIEANRKKATLLLYDENYHLAKAKIMTAINEFNLQMSERTEAAVRTAKYTSLFFMAIFISGLLAAGILLWQAYLSLRNSLGGSAEEVKAHISKIGHGDFSTPPSDTEYTNESVRAGLFEMQHQLLMHETERNLASAVIKQSQSDLEEAQRIAHIGSWQMDPAYNHVIWSNELYRIFGLNPSLPPPGYEEQRKLFTTESWERLNMAMSGIVESGTPFETELEIIKADGTRGWILSRGEAIKNAQGNIITLHGISADIGERKQAAEMNNTLRDQLLQATKMEAVGHLTAGIAHDFNNMLGAMMGYTELTKQVVSSGQVQNVARYQDEILKAGQRAKELIAQMLTFSRMPSESNKKDIPNILITPVLKEVVSMLRSSIPSSIDLNYHSEDANLRTRIQPVNLHQIILNLTVNARDAMGEYGRIDLKLSRQHLSESICASCQHVFEGDFVRLTVSDTGSGIEGHLLQNIFNPFFTTKAVGKGTGMGLSVVHGLVHALGGHIQVESTMGRGSKISILLPEVIEHHADISLQEALGNTDSSLAGVRIMVVDDELSMTSMLREFLAMHGVITTIFNSPVAALNELEEHPDKIDLVITDETMPNLSGMHMAEHMLKCRPGLPIILCTGYSEHATPELAKQAGLVDFLYKPLNLKDLLQKIHHALKSTNPPKGR
jgi:signal transduction histidine kinase/CheY-like chemotaxis protein